ncbi:ThiF family adenylyltransferase [Peribacillus frigoritolerans]|uniref:ThiF family adenylyltransferase n=1 Tax=Peribacillus frigoritolerans TaxID=450367 RepID=UPI0025A0584D|nr:ThiF family adenylyltransferase [Peribacillus frigoritolerans]MDM5305810.1 ThiF family adenylyltransferase [Peribacillus frigoritolerans]
MNTDFQKLLQEKEYLDKVIEVESFHYELFFKLRNGYQLPLTITFSPLFPTQLPIVHINQKYHHIPNIPHVMSSGLVCFLDKEGVIWSDLPERTLDFVFNRVEQVLISDSPQIESHREFSYYFGTLDNIEPIFSVYTPDDEPKEISVLAMGGKPFAFLTDHMESRSLLGKLLNSNINSRNLEKAFYIPLDHTYEGKVPQLDRFWSNEEIINIIRNHVTNDTLLKINKFSTNKKRYFYLLRIPLLTGDQTIIGLWYEKINHSLSKRVNPLIDDSIAEDFNVTPLFVFRNDDTTLVERGGGVQKPLNALLVGCGSVGSDLLFMLARSGIKHFTLIDNDKLKIENSYRHFMGMNKSIESKAKVKLLKEEFENRYPNVQIQTIENEVLDTIENGKIDLADFDLILVAIGDPNIERRLNKLILESSTPAIFTWVEAYGIGGHALVVNNGEKGCYECLIDNELRMYSSFAGKSDIPFIKNMNGCAGSFTPYGSIDSMETALLASRLVLKYLNNDIKGNPLVSWKGSAKTFEENGFLTSDRYKQPTDILNHEDYEYINKSCKICSNLKDEAYSNDQS